jgi:hypothetical protein
MSKRDNGLNIGLPFQNSYDITIQELMGYTTWLNAGVADKAASANPP